MGKRKSLKIAFQLHKSQRSNQQFNTNPFVRTKTSNELYKQEIIDVKTVFEVNNARVVAEDIMAYIQLNLVEKTKGKDYIDVMKPQFVDFLTQDDFLQNRHNSTIS